MNKKNNLTGFEIAIIGMAGRFPGAKNVEEFWENLVNGKESISFFTDEELLQAGVEPGTLVNHDYVKAFGFLEGGMNFDSFFFGYNNLEAALMDPQIRIFHECAWEALEDAGYCPSSYNGLIGLYAGVPSNFNWVALAALSPDTLIIGESAAQLLMDKDFLGGWVSFKLDLKGPSYTLTTACSTSLVAIHVACQAILNGECDMALGGGVRVSCFNKGGYFYRDGLPRSRDGHVRAFDAGPHGIVGGDGAAVVVLKSLEDALSDRDYIYALIKGSAINNDGLNKVGFAAPSIEGQARVIRAALEMAEVKPETIGYIETHGTATELGDPVEIQALKLAFDTNKRQYCRIGSVKTNIGHLDAAAGAAGLIKAALCIKHKVIPASLHFKRPNPKIDFENSPFYVNPGLSEWKDELTPRRAGISSFGLGGTNAHAIIEEALPPEASFESRPFQLLLISAKSRAALDRNTQNLALHFEKNPGINLADAAYTLQTGREAFKYRCMEVCSNREQALHFLSAAGREDLQTHAVSEEKPSLVFMFSGQGSQYVDMGLDLYNQEPQFREEIDRCFHILESLCDVNIKDILYPAGKRLSDSKKKIAQYGGPITLIFEYSLAKLLMKWGLKPQAMIGYSFGEYTAACMAGVFCLEDALKLALRRGSMMLDMPVGSMMSVPLPEEKLKHLLNGDIDIAAVNGPEFCIVSGPPGPIKRLRDELRAGGHDAYRLGVLRAGHSKMMVPFKEELTTHFEGIQLGTPKIPYISGLTGNWITRQQATSPGYWARHMTETMRFHDGVGLLLQELNPIFIQVGADRGLPLYVDMHPLKGEKNLALNLVRYTKEECNDVAFLMKGIGRLWLFGANVDWKGFYAHEKRGRISLPTYSFERTYYPPIGNPGKVITSIRSGKVVDTPLLTHRQDDDAAAKVVDADSPSVQHKRKRPELKVKYAPPTDDMEQKLVDIFQSFFGIEPVGIYDDFYELGGDSIRAAQLTTLIKKTGGGITVSIRQLLFFQNIHDICAGLRKESGTGVMENMVNQSPPASEKKKLALKDEISPEEQILLEKELKKLNRLSDLLKKNNPAREYEVAPIQTFSLTPPYKRAKKDIVLYYTDFFYPTESDTIRDTLAASIQRNSLLRSVIIERDGNHFIREYESFSNIRLPFIDLSSYSPSGREKIVDVIILYLYKSMKVLDHVLFRPVVLKMDQAHWRLVLVSNHLICDGVCVGILDKQFHSFMREMEAPREKVDSKTDYYDYVEFMKKQNYDHIDLGKYINLKDYSSSNDTVLENYKMAEVKFESLEVDISIIDEKFKAYYNEIALWVFAKVIGDLFSVDNVPIEYVTNGRIYKDGDFNSILGNFHDIIPVLISLKNDPWVEIVRFIDYKLFVKENNLNFMNYVVKGYISDLKNAKLNSPFSFNALIGHSNSIEETAHRRRAKVFKYSSPHLSILLWEDFSAGKLWVKFTHNTGLILKEIFKKKYFYLVDYLAKKN